jgi:hypothetical protein
VHPLGRPRTKNQHQAFSTEPERESLPPCQPRGLLTRAQIRDPFDGELISLEMESSDTVDNVKARFKTRRTKDPSQDQHWQDVSFPASWELLRPVSR